MRKREEKNMRLTFEKLTGERNIQAGRLLVVLHNHPSVSLETFIKKFLLTLTRVAQLVGCHPAKQKVTGSVPVAKD